MSPPAHLARSPVGLADQVWLEAVGREPGENSPWYRSRVLAQRPKLARERLIPQEWLNLALRGYPGINSGISRYLKGSGFFVLSGFNRLSIL